MSIDSSWTDVELLEFEAELDASADKILDLIEEARGKMTDPERKRLAASIMETARRTTSEG